jgi:hypothetical protein
MSETNQFQESSVASHNPYASFLDQVEKPARYIGGEHFVTKKNWNEAIARVALCFPDTYEIGMSHLGFKILYDESAATPLCDVQWIFGWETVKLSNAILSVDRIVRMRS